MFKLNLRALSRALTVSSVMMLAPVAMAQSDSAEIDLAIVAAPECGPRARTLRVPPLCGTGLPAVCVGGRWKCESCNGVDDTGAGVPDEGRHELCERPLVDNECGPGECKLTWAFGDTPLGVRRVTRCVYPESPDACDDGNRCTVDWCDGKGTCEREPIVGCFDVKLRARVRQFAPESQLTLTITGGRPNAVHDVQISGVPDVAPESFALTTDATGAASHTKSFSFTWGLPTTCGRSLPPVQITVTERGMAANRASASVSAFSIRPCR